MRVTRLKLVNLRAIEAAEFRFQPGFNLIVGVNGVGKTTALDALAVCLSAITRPVDGLRGQQTKPFSVGDIRIGTEALTVECGIQIGGTTYAYLIHEPRKSSESQEGKAGMPREQVLDTPRLAEFVGDAPKVAIGDSEGGRPLAVLFSTRRAQPSERTPSRSMAAGGIRAGYADAFANRELRLGEFAAWMQVQQALKSEKPTATRVLDAFESAVTRFLPGYSNLRVDGDDEPKLVIDRGEITTLRIADLSDAERAQVATAIEWTDNWMALNWSGQLLPPNPTLTPDELSKAYSSKKAQTLAEAVARFVPSCENLRPDGEGNENQIIDRKPTTLETSQLSDGERGTLAIVLDLTRRLVQANPDMNDPAQEAEAVVLIDEIELHLHPGWQRQTVRNLTATFPKCQFIATTHSPQIIGEVEHDRIQIMAAGQVYSPTHSYGVDSSRVLEEIMDANPRTQEVDELLSRISELIGQQQFDDARVVLAQIVERLGGSDPEVTRIRTLLDFVEGKD